MQEEQNKTLKVYFRWPFFLGIVLVVLSVFGFLLDPRLGFYLAVVTTVYFLLAILLYILYRRWIRKMLIRFGEAYSEGKSAFFEDFEIPIAFLNGIGEIYQTNGAFRRIFGCEEGSNLRAVITELRNIDFEKQQSFQLTFQENHYTLRWVKMTEKLAKDMELLTDSEEDALYSICFLNDTELLRTKEELRAERNVIASIYIDNYEEVMASTEPALRGVLSALLDKRVLAYATSFHAVLRKMEKDRYFLTVNQKYFEEMKADKFSLLQKIKETKNKNEVEATISIGFGFGGETYDKNYEFARTAIDAALARGGDQVVMKNHDEMSYFGGKATGSPKNSKVRARVKAKTLRESIESYDNVLIMGHPISDFDCIGAAVGVYRMAKFSGKDARILLDTRHTGVQPLLQTFEKEQDIFITKEQALLNFTERTLLVVVDTNRPGYTVAPELLKQAKAVIVIDHHRQAADKIENTLLSYAEPYASSASELVAELLQYYDEKIRLARNEADAIFAGIVMDTNNFEDKSGVRTFEAAAYLRRNGADVTKVRKIFRDSEEDYKLRAKTISLAQTFGDSFIISICESDSETSNQTMVAAQAANELLEIRGIKASFVLTEYQGKIYISARSIDEVNVQTMMEKLGGGGHQSVAGAQLADITMEEAVEKLKAVITEGEKE